MGLGRTGALAAALSAAAGCTTEIQVFEGQVNCLASRDCPEGLICNPREKICVLPASNHAPVLEVADATLRELDELLLQITVTDPEGDDVTLSADVPEQIHNEQEDPDTGEVVRVDAFNAETRTLRWQTGYDDAGTYEIVFVAEDDGEPPLRTTETITVRVRNLNAPPQITNVGGVVPDESGECFLELNPRVPREIVGSAKDLDGDELVWSSSEQPVGAEFDADGGVLTWTPRIDQAGVHPYQLRVRDSEGASSEVRCLLQVVQENLPPVPLAGFDRSGREGLPLTLNGGASDPNGDTELTYSWDPGDGSDPLLGAVVSHTYVEDGSYTSVLTVVDDAGGSGTDTAAALIANRPPVPAVTLHAPPAEEGALERITVTANDPGILDTHTFTVDWDGDGSPEVNLAPGGEHSYRYRDDGSVTLLATVRDDDGGVGTAELRVNVSNVAPAPTLTYDGPAVAGSPILLQAAPGDPGVDDSHRYAFDLDGNSTFEVDTGSDAFISHTFFTEGSHVVRVRATDDSGGTGDALVVVHVGRATWQPLELSPAPGARSHASVVLQSDSGATPVAWLYGGLDASGSGLSDLWRLELAPGRELARRLLGEGETPPPAGGHIAAWDGAAGRMLLSHVDAQLRTYVMRPAQGDRTQPEWRRFSGGDPCRSSAARRRRRGAPARMGRCSRWAGGRTAASATRCGCTAPPSRAICCGGS